MTKQEIEAKREQIAQDYVTVVNRVFNAELVIKEKGGAEILEKVRTMPAGEERDKLCAEYELLISREIISCMPDKDVEEWICDE